MRKKPSHNSESITPLAVTNYRDIRKIFGIKRKNRRAHMHILGKTGTGKSTLIANMVISDIADNQGLALIDPHGDLAEQILECIPPGRIPDVIYFNPADLKYPIPLNPLERVSPDARHLAVSGLISAFRKIWPEFWGPRLEHILRHTLLTLIEYGDSTLLDVTRLLTIKEYREQVIRGVANQAVRDFWYGEFDRYSAWLRSEAISPILNKMGQFLTSAPLRNILAHKKSAFNFRRLMDEGKILIVNLAKGKLGEDNSTLLGSILVSQIQLAALSRSDIPENDRRSFYLFIDEVHSFMTLSLADALSEARKYGLHLILAHQYIAQLEEKLRSAIFGNVGTLISFRVGAEDAEYLAREFKPFFGEADLISLSNFHIYLKLMIDGMSSEPFSAITLPPCPRKFSLAREIIRLSREKYGCARKAASKQMLSDHPCDVSNALNQPSLF